MIPRAGNRCFCFGYYNKLKTKLEYETSEAALPKRSIGNDQKCTILHVRLTTAMALGSLWTGQGTSFLFIASGATENICPHNCFQSENWESDSYMIWSTSQNRIIKKQTETEYINANHNGFIREYLNENLMVGQFRGRRYNTTLAVNVKWGSYIGSDNLTQ